MKRGVLGGIEGTDGAGKGSTIKKLHKLALSEGYNFVSMKFPRYETPTGDTVKDYLFGEFGDGSRLPPMLSSSLYAVDRRIATPEIERLLSNGVNVITDRYIGSNLAHQAAKYPSWKEREEFIKWCINYEHEKKGVPRQSIVACLHLPKEIAVQSATDRGARDTHETNEDYQAEVVKTYLWLAENQPNWHLIDCMHPTENRRKTEVEVALDVWKLFKSHLTK